MTTTPETPSRAFTYAGVFLVAQATLMLEILLTRITSVSAWYHLAFFVISLGMLGMTAGAVLIFLWPRLFEDADVPSRLHQSALGFALSIPCGVAFTLALPLSPVSDFMSFLALLVTGAALAAPFILGGITLTLALTRAGLPPGLVYGVDLTGAAAGCAVIIPLLDAVDAPSAAILCGAVAALSAWAFARANGRPSRAAPLTAALLFAAAIANTSAPSPPLRPAWVKGKLEDPSLHIFSRWNTYSRVTVGKSAEGPPTFWGKGRHTPPEILAPIEQRMLEIDGAAGTVMARFGKDLSDHAYLAWDITATAHNLRPSGPAAVIGVGGGRDVLEAARVGHKPVVAVELNDLIVDLHEKEMRDFSGLMQIDGLTLVRDEARSYMARDTMRYQVITMSLIDTWASTGAGAYSLSENGLYTADAWGVFLDRLDEGGIFTVSRWYFMDSPGETARMLALAMEAVWSRGAVNPQLHIVLLQTEFISTLLLSPTPFSMADIDRIQEVCVAKGFNMLMTPRKSPVHPMLRGVAAQPTRQALREYTSSQRLDLTPPTDERPFFFNMLKPGDWLRSRAEMDKLDYGFLGNLQATQTLLYATLVSLLLTLLTLAFPLASRFRQLAAFDRRDVAAALAYFALIGLGFMFVEMGLLSRLSVFLGHPTLALAVLLGGIIFFTGMGSLLSAHIDPSDRRWARSYPLIPALLVLIAGAVMQPLMQTLQSSGAPMRIAASLALIAPPALGLGLCFPLGLSLVERLEAARAGGSAEHPRLGPWLWGINGAFGVCASGLGLGTSMVWGVQTTLAVGACCYLVLPLLSDRLARAGGS
ncbi:MAG: hypothetical protein OEZ06_01380 [Myxococcales bacterium]|nr:hypothetical protein [Myxococcales bacterium]